MLPAPRTTAVCTPMSWTALISSAMMPTFSGSIPYSRSPMRDSPESLSRMRENAGESGTDGEAREALDDDGFAELAGQLGADLLDRLALVLVGVDVHLVHE